MDKGNYRGNSGDVAQGGYDDTNLSSTDRYFLHKQRVILPPFKKGTRTESEIRRDMGIANLFNDAREAIKNGEDPKKVVENTNQHMPEGYRGSASLLGSLKDSDPSLVGLLGWSSS